jgi:hypothetical protein
MSFAVAELHDTGTGYSYHGTIRLTEGYVRFTALYSTNCQFIVIVV